MEYFKISSLAVLATFLLLFSIECKFNSRFCDHKKFFTPYMKLYNEEPGGKLLYEINEGFRFIYNLRDVFICIHGPAFVYFKESTVEGEREFQGARFHIFVHECFYINVPHNIANIRALANISTVESTSFVSSGHLLHPLADDEYSECENSIPHFSSGGRSAMSMPRSPTLHKRIWGIYLFGKPADFTSPKLQIFYAPYYEIRTAFSYSNDISECPPISTTKFGFSMMAIGNISACISIQNQSYRVSSSISNPTGNTSASQIQICFRAQKNETFDQLIQSTNYTANINILQGDLDSITGHGTEAGLHSHYNDDYLVSTTCGTDSEDIVLDECVSLPTVEDACRSSTPDINYACKILKIITGIEILTIPNELNWLEEILQLIEIIFQTTCKQFISTDFINQIFTLIKIYINEVANSIIKRDFWNFVVPALQICKNKIEPLKFNFKAFENVTQFKQEIRFLKKNEDGAEEPIELKYYTELADHEFSFNHIIDIVWMSFGTVLGICPYYSTDTGGSISSRFYTMLSEDLFIPLNTSWTSSKHNQAYEILLGKYLNYEMHVKIRSCYEASYVQTETTSYRFPRPLVVPISACESVANAFV